MPKFQIRCYKHMSKLFQARYYLHSSVVLRIGKVHVGNLAYIYFTLLRKKYSNCISSFISELKTSYQCKIKRFVIHIEVFGSEESHFYLSLYYISHNYKMYIQISLMTLLYVVTIYKM